RTRRAASASSLDSASMMGLIAASFTDSGREDRRRGPEDPGPPRARLRAACLLLVRYRDEPLIREREELVGMNRHATQLLVVATVIRQCPQEGVRRLLREDCMKFPVDGPALFVIQ